MHKNITVILTLFKTPPKKLETLKQYKNFKTIIFAQSSSKNFKKELKEISNIDFKFFYSKKNLGLSKATNFLISKVKTKYFLFTQPDIMINEKSIKYLYDAFKINKNIIFAGPSFEKKRNIKEILYKNKLDAACMLCDTKKTKNIGFFDEDFFLYWEDIFLMRKISLSKFKMVQINKAYANHSTGESSEKNIKIEYLKNLNFKYSEYVYDLKTQNLRILKITRQFMQNLFFFPINFITLRQKIFIKNISTVVAVIKFLLFLLRSNFSLKKKPKLFIK